MCKHFLRDEEDYLEDNPGRTCRHICFNGTLEKHMVKRYAFKHMFLQISSKTLGMATFQSGLTLHQHFWRVLLWFLPLLDFQKAPAGVLSFSWCLFQENQTPDIHTKTPKSSPPSGFHPKFSLMKTVFKRSTLPKHTLQPLYGLWGASSCFPILCYSGKQFISQGLGHLGVWKGPKHSKKGFTAYLASQLPLSRTTMVSSVLSLAQGWAEPQAARRLCFHPTKYSAGPGNHCQASWQEVQQENYIN